MTTANKITIGRFVLIPVFVTFAVLYSISISQGEENITWRIWALIIFALAGVSDALDGYIARKFDQRSALGEFLDPLADKSLLIMALFTLSFSSWHAGLPIWFGILCITRDAVIMGGWVVINKRNGKVEMNPILSSKICTVLQLLCVCWVLIDFWSKERHLGLDILIYVTTAFTIFSFIQYLREGVRQINIDLEGER